MVLNEPETLLGALDLSDEEDALRLEIFKDCGATKVLGQGLLTTPAWEWGSR